jgi:hypothetical protein
LLSGADMSFSHGRRWENDNLKLGERRGAVKADSRLLLAPQLGQ